VSRASETAPQESNREVECPPDHRRSLDAWMQATGLRRSRPGSRLHEYESSGVVASSVASPVAR
jgi:hypothetical protein